MQNKKISYVLQRKLKKTLTEENKSIFYSRNKKKKLRSCQDSNLESSDP